MPSEEALREAGIILKAKGLLRGYPDVLLDESEELYLDGIVEWIATLVDRKNNTIIRQAEDIAEGLKRHVIPLDKKIGELRTDLKKLKKEVRHED